MIAVPIYNELIDFLAGGFTPQEMIQYQPSNEMKEKVWDLVQKEKNTGLTEAEQSELNYYMQLEHIIRMAKARARKHLV